MAERAGGHRGGSGPRHPGAVLADVGLAGVPVARWRRSAGIWVATGLLFLLSAVFQPKSLGSSALAALWPFAAVLILAAVGQTLVVQQRGIDLSVPGFISLTVVLVTHIPDGNAARLGPAILLAYAI